MVYIKLQGSLYSRLKKFIEPSTLVTCERQFFIPYPEFKRIASSHNMHIHQEIGRQDIITYNDMELMLEREKQTPEQRRVIEQLKNKSQVRKLKFLHSKNTDDFYFEKKHEQKGVKELTESISYAMAFIFSFFMAGLTGFYVGEYFLGWPFASSMILALIFIVVTMVVETSLFIIRQYSIDEKKRRKSNPEKDSTRKKRTKAGKDKKE